MTEANAPRPPLLIYSLNKGMVVGIVSCLIVLVTYMLDYGLLVKWWFGLVSMTFLTGLVTYFGLKYRQLGTGYLSFGRSFRLVLTTFLISVVLQIAFNLFLYQVLDPELPDMLTSEIIENSEGYMRSMGLSQGSIDDQIQLMKKEIPKQFTLLGQLKASWIIFILICILSLISASIIKKNEPLIEKP